MSKKNNEKVVLTEEEILEILKARLIKGDTVSALCEDLGISDYALFGYVKKLKDENINITFTDQGKDMKLVINNHPDYTKENIKIDVSWFNKDANRLTEAIFFKLYPTEGEVSLEKLGENIDPYKVVSKGSRNLHVVKNAKVKNNKNTLKITNLSSALLSMGKGKILEFDNKFESIRKDGISFVLQNNVWGTNFPLWYEDNARFEFEIKKKQQNKIKNQKVSRETITNGESNDKMFHVKQ